MPTFRYKGYARNGSARSGTIEADSLRTARELLRKQGILPSDLEAAGAEQNQSFLGRLRTRVTVAELALFTRRLATLVAASVPLHEALTALQNQERNQELKAVLGRTADRLAEGATLARALADEPALFKENYVAMVAAGEAGGALDRVLMRLADFLERQEALRRTVSSAMAYPMLMALVGSGVMVFLLTFVIPKITGIFADSKATLPYLTIALLAISNGLRKAWWALLLLIVIVIMIYRRLKRSPAFMLRRDQQLVKLPLFGPLLQTLVLSRFANILSLLLGSGVPLLKALEISSDAVVNRAYRAVLQTARTSVAEGGSLSGILGNSALFPPMLVHLISVGEKSGTLVESLETAGQSYEKEFEASTTRLVGLLEPIMILVMGLVVGLVVIAVLLPIFELNQLVK